MRFLTRLLPLIVAGHLTVTGCERLPPTETAPMPVSISLDAPDESFRLDAAARANINSMYDPDALERLLQLVHPDQRMDILAHFQIEPFDGQRRGLLVEIFDPKLDPLLDPVWTPMWENATDEEVEANIYGLRGRATVLKQRQEMRERRRTEPE
jgi:tRNA A37 N6-isopentenylltransferase MiaA